MDTAIQTPRLVASLGLVAALALGGCASTKDYAAASEPEIAQARLAIKEAEARQAGEHAGADLERARTKLANAEAAMRRDETQRAERFAAEALVDAQTAAAKADATHAEATASEIEQTLTQLREEVNRVREAP